MGTSRVKRMTRMFERTDAFEQDIESCDVSDVRTMASMFKNSGFNGRLDEWTVQSVTDFSNMFNEAGQFDQCLSTWGGKVADHSDTSCMFYDAGCSGLNTGSCEVQEKDV